MGTILASFRDVAVLVCVIAKLNMYVKTLMVCVPKCFRCRFEMPSGPVIICDVNGGIMFLCLEMACRRLSCVCLVIHVFARTLMQSVCLTYLPVLYPRVLCFCVLGPHSYLVYLFSTRFQSYFGVAFSVI